MKCRRRRGGDGKGIQLEYIFSVIFDFPNRTVTASGEGPRRQLENAVVADGIRFFLYTIFILRPSIYCLFIFVAPALSFNFVLETLMQRYLLLVALPISKPLPLGIFLNVFSKIKLLI